MSGASRYKEKTAVYGTSKPPFAKNRATLNDLSQGSKHTAIPISSSSQGTRSKRDTPVNTGGGTKKTGTAKRGRFDLDSDEDEGALPKKTNIRKKSSVYIHTSPKKQSTKDIELLSLFDDDNDGSPKKKKHDDLDEFSIDLMLANSEKLISSLPSAEETNNKKEANSMTSKIDQLLKDADVSELSFNGEKHNEDDVEEDSRYIEDLTNTSDIVGDFFDDKRRSKEVRAKYKREGAFKPKGSYYTIEQLTAKFKKYKSKIEDLILLSDSIDVSDANDKQESKFLVEAVTLFQNSKRPFITNEEILNFDKKKYFGFIGNKRSNYLSKLIIEQFDTLLNRQLKRSKFLQFWSLVNYNLYVLTPHLISWIIKDDERLDEIEHVYKMMEDTSDYGWFIMDDLTLKHKRDLDELEKSLYR